MIGIISDAHGNIYGLKRCINLLEAQNVQELFFLGDAVNYFSKAREVLDLLKIKKARCIKGNHEDFLLKQKEFPLEKRKIYNLDFTKMTLKKGDYKFISSWEDSIELKFDEVKILMVHGSPFNYLEEYVYPNSDFAKFLDLEYDFIFMGHTHIPFLQHMDDKVLVNVGSAGFSRDDGKFISCVTFDIGKRKVAILKDNFPIEDLDNLQPFHNYIYEVLGRRKNN